MTDSLGSVESVADFMSLIDETWVRWTKESQFVADIWFRGQCDASWSLVPSAMRPPFSTVNEHRYRHDFVLRAQPFIHEATQPPKDDWDWYFLMQHHGIPTRLLDWTESALVALYFSVSSAPDVDGRVWVLDPRKVNAALANIGAYIPIYSDEIVAGYLPQLWDEDEQKLTKGAIAIDPPLNSPRLAAQRGKFTVHGRGVKALDEYASLASALLSITIPAKSKGRITRQLMAAGVGHSTLFPGLAGLGAEIRDQYAYGHHI